MTRGLEDTDEAVRACAACLIPAFIAVSTRSQAKVVSAAVSALDALKGEPDPSTLHAVCM